MSTTAHGWCIMFAHVGPSSRRKVYALLLATLLSIVHLSICIPLDDFYDFDVLNDQRTKYVDDGGSDLISLGLNFPFFNRTDYQKLYVNNNGFISFLEELTSYRPTNFSDPNYDEKIALIAPYWADVDIEHVRDTDFNETVVYRQSNESHILERATADVREYFIDQREFSARMVFISTWYKVGYYGATGEGKKKRNTFQAVMVTDGEKSFVIFNYNKTVWTTGANSNGDPETGLEGLPAVVGFHSGNGTYFTLEHSGTDEIIDVVRRSNLPVPIPGKYIFRVDGAKVDNLSCAANRKLVIKPSTISMLGAEAIRVTGPCFDSRLSVTARIPEIPGMTFPCHVISFKDAVCVPPALFRTGELTFEILFGGDDKIYSTTLNSVNLLNMPVKLERLKPDKWRAGSMVRVSWDTAEGIPSSKSKTLQVLAYSKADTSFVPSFVPVGDNKTVQKMQTSRQFKLPDEDELSPYSTLVTRLCWEQLNSIYPRCIWSDVFPVRWKQQNSEEKSQKWCEEWLERERTHVPRVAANAPFCPCVQTIADDDVGHFHRDPSCDSKNGAASTNCIYNPDAHQCFRRNLKSPTDSGETCCYDNAGELMDIRVSAGAGTHQRYHYKSQDPDAGDPVVPYFSYFEEDLLPKLHCCDYSRANCSGFKTYRQATTCGNYTAPTPAQAAGDPHLVTLDGKNYSFNGLGDFYLLRHNTSELVIQVRARQATDEHGAFQNASIFSSVAVAMPSVSDTVEVRKNGDTADVLVNKNVIDDLSTSQFFKNISLILNDNGGYTVVVDPVSVSVTIDVTPDLLNIIVFISEDSYKGNILGLLGNYNGDPEDDFIASDGKRLPGDASESNIHYNFGMTWAVPEADSYLSADPSYNVAEQNDYVPVFITEISDSDLPEGTRELCKTNIQCTFDYMVTGKESIAKSTMQFTTKFDEMKKKFEENIIRCEFLEVPENGNRTITGNTVGSLAMFKCDPGYELIPDNAVRRCLEVDSQARWSGEDVKCAIEIVAPKSTDKLLTYMLAIGGSVMLVLIVIVVTSVYLKRRRVPKPPDPGPIPLEPRDIPISVFENPYFMQSLQTLMKDGRYRIPRPHYVDPSIYQEYF